MPLILRSRSKARIEIQWDGALPVEIAIISQDHADIRLYRTTLADSDRLQLDLNEIDFSQIDHLDELKLIAIVEGQEYEPGSVTEPLAVLKCSQTGCGLWGHAREDGYCKHCGRRVRDQKSSYGFPRLELSNTSVVLWNGVTGLLGKKQEARQEQEGLASLGWYSDKDHAKDYVEIMEERHNPELAKNFIRLQDLLRQSDLLDKAWRPPLACFQEEFQRTIWIYYPWLPNQHKWRYISAASYIATEQVELLSISEILTVGIELCKIAEKIHAEGHLWASLKLSDLILCRNKGNNLAIYLRSRDIAWQFPPSKILLDTCLMPIELFWEEPRPENHEVTEVYIIAALMYFLAAKAPNLLCYNAISFPYGLPTLKLFRTPELFPLTTSLTSHFESVINQALLLNPADRGYRTVAELHAALDRLLTAPLPNWQGRYVFDIGEVLDIGNAKRDDDLSKNQDNLFSTIATLEKQSWGAFMLCDGISTAAIGSGDLASKIAIGTLQDLWQPHNEQERRTVCQYAQKDFGKACTFLNNLVSEANHRIRLNVEQLGSPAELEDAVIMGSTVILGLIYEESLVFGWLGDSLIYRISDWGWERLNYADNERSLRLREGRPMEEFKDSGNALTHCIGAHFYREPNIRLHFGLTHLYPEEYILICSDGIPDYIEPESFYVYHENYQMLRITSVLREYEHNVLLNSKAMATMLVSAVNRVGGGYDNLAAILIRLVSEKAISKERSFEKLRALFLNMQAAMRDSSYQTTNKLVLSKEYQKHPEPKS